MWEFIKDRNGGTDLICPLLGADKGRMNKDSSLIFSELLYSFLASHTNNFITKDITFIIYPGDISSEFVDLYKIKNIFEIVCNSENIERISIDGDAITL